jgi:hypothetical protein
MNIFYPVFVLLFYTLTIYAWMGYRRYGAVSRGEVPTVYYKTFSGEEPEHLRVLSRHVSNLLEAPLLFYVGSLIAFVTGTTGSAVVLLAWLYVGLRLIHGYVHLGSNVVVWRFRVFALSMVLLLIYLALIAFGIFSRG